MSDLTTRQLAWIRKGERGLSSEALFDHMTGHAIARANSGADHPRDPSDFNRCVMMLEQCELRARLPEASTISPVWRALISRWEDLEKLLAEAKRHGWYKPEGKQASRDLYDLMKELGA